MQQAAIVAALLWHHEARAEPRAAQPYQRLYTHIAAATWGGVLPPVASLAAQIEAESSWRCSAVSPVGARGCAQFMPATARWLSSMYPSLASGAVNDPAWAFEAQVRYLQWLYRRIDAANECERMAFALTDYNGGTKWRLKRQALSRAPRVCFDATCTINPGIAPGSQRENAQYPVRILKTLAPRYTSWGRKACR